MLAALEKGNEVVRQIGRASDHLVLRYQRSDNSHHLYLLSLRFMVAVVRSLISETTVFLVTHSVSSFVEFFDDLSLEPFTFDLQYF